jgi:hypothetical protein
MPDADSFVTSIHASVVTGLLYEQSRPALVGFAIISQLVLVPIFFIANRLRHQTTMSVFGPRRTSLVAPHMSAFGCKADMTFAAHMSAPDPKRTLHCDKRGV